MVETEFFEKRFKGDKERALKNFDNFVTLQPEDVAD